MMSMWIKTSWLMVLILLPITSQAEHIYLLAMNANVKGLQYTHLDRLKIINSFKAVYGTKKLTVYPINNVTRQKYHVGMQWLQQVVQPNDQVIVYFSGHGTRIPDRNGDEGKGDGYDEAWLGYSANGAVDFNQVIIDDQLAADIGRLAPRRLTVILDTCHSGGMHKTLNNHQQAVSKFIPYPVKKSASKKMVLRSQMRPQWEIRHEGAKSMMATRHAVLFAASAEAESALEFNQMNLQGGIFTHYFANVLRATGQIEQAFQQAKQRVMKQTQNRQTPQRYVY